MLPVQYARGAMRSTPTWAPPPCFPHCIPARVDGSIPRRAALRHRSGGKVYHRSNPPHPRPAHRILMGPPPRVPRQTRVREGGQVLSTVGPGVRDWSPPYGLGPPRGGARLVAPLCGDLRRDSCDLAATGGGFAVHRPKDVVRG